KMMSGGIAEADFCLRLPDGIRERTAAGHDNAPASTARQRADPTRKMPRAGKTAAKLDHDDVSVVHLVGGSAFARRRRKQMKNFGYTRRPLPLDFDSHPARADLNFLYFHSDALDLRVIENEVGNPFRERFKQRNVTFGGNQSDAVCNNVVREHVAHVLRWLGGPGNFCFDVEAHSLRI